jgi:WD40 repeat protein
MKTDVSWIKEMMSSGYQLPVCWRSAPWLMGEKELILKCPAGNKITDLQFSPDGNRLVVALQFGIVQIWDVKKRCVVHSIETNRRNQAIALSRDGHYLAIATLPFIETQSGSVLVWDMKTSRVRNRILLSRPLALTFGEDDQLFIGQDAGQHMKALGVLDINEESMTYLPQQILKTVWTLDYSTERGILGAAGYNTFGDESLVLFTQLKTATDFDSHKKAMYK